MADTGWIFPGTAVGDRGAGDADWSNPDNIKIDDGSDASVNLGGGPTEDSRGLAASNFDFSSIPSGATIDGIEVRVEDYLVAGGGVSVDWSNCRLILADDSDGSENKESELLDPSFSDQTDEAGGASDLWGETITRADVQDVDFGFFVGVTLVAGTPTTHVDSMQMKVFYTEAAGINTIIIVPTGPPLS